MSFVLKNINKSFFIKKKEIKILKNINLTFPDKGLVFICGKSGSGKTTLLNLLSKIDKQTSGDIFYKNRKITNLKEKEIAHFRNKELGIVFQNFNLFENETVLENILTPTRIFAPNKKEKLDVEKMVEEVGLNKSILIKKVKDLSGGEKQRVAIIRALINNPSVILADEPTGSLDSKTSYSVMKILKTLSKDRLVIVVSHNDTLVNEFNDYRILLKDGKIAYSSLPTNVEIKEDSMKTKNHKFSYKWTYENGLRKLKYKKSKYVLSCLSIIVAFLANVLIMGYITGSKDSAIKEAKQQADYGVLTLSHESTSKTDSLLNVVKQRRPLKDEIIQLETKFNESIFDYDLSYFLNQQSDLKFNDTVIDNVMFQPLYSFDNNYLNPSLIVQGNVSKEDNFKEVIVNEVFIKTFFQDKTFDLNNNELNLSIKLKFNAKLDDLSEIDGYFTLEENFKIVAVVKDFKFLEMPKIYYSYTSFKEKLMEVIVDEKTNLNAYELIVNCSPLEPLTSYRYLVFNKTNTNEKYYEQMLKHKDNGLIFTSQPHIRLNSFLDLLEASSIGLSLFVVIAILGCSLIIGILAFSSYSEDKKEIAILYSLGANKEQILDIYVSSNLMVTIVSMVFAILLSPIFSFLLNIVLEKTMGVPNLISNFITNFTSGGMLILMIMFFVGLLVSFLSVAVPLTFGSGLNLSQELKND